MQIIALCVAITCVAGLPSFGLVQDNQDNEVVATAQQSQVKALGEQFLREDFDGLADEGDVRFWRSKYSKEHMTKEKQLGPMGIQLRSARPVDVPMFYLVGSWKVNKIDVRGRHAMIVAEFERLARAKYNENAQKFEYQKDIQSHDIQVVNLKFEEGQWYIDGPPVLRMSAKVYRESVAYDIAIKERFLAQKVKKNVKTRKLQETIKASTQELEILKSSFEALNAVLDSCAPTR